MVKFTAHTKREGELFCRLTLSHLQKCKNFLKTCLVSGEAWNFNFSEATQEETLKFGAVDTIFRILRALKDQKLIVVDGQMFKIQPGDSIDDLGQEIEDYISESGRCFSVTEDSEKQLVISFHGEE